MNRAERLADLVGACVKTPGFHMNKLYRTDGLTQNEPIHQLYANYYRDEQYEFVASSDHDEQLALLNDDIALHSSDYLDHLQTYHTGSYGSLRDLRNEADSKCGKVRTYCLCELLDTIHTSLADYITNINAAAHEESSPLAMSKQLIESYGLFVRFIVLFETKLPALSALIAAVNSESYPFSLWKCLHGEFVEGVISPLTSQLLAGVCEMVKQRREHNLTHLLDSEEEESSVEEVEDLVWVTKATLGMLINAKLDEKTIYRLESSKLPLVEISALLETAISEQTIELYEQHKGQFTTFELWSRAVAADVDVLDTLLLPSSVERLLTTCLKTAQSILKTEETILEYDNHGHIMHDYEIDICVHSLGVPA
jgi:hypothetical protein